LHNVKRGGEIFKNKSKASFKSLARNVLKKIAGHFYAMQEQISLEKAT